MGADLVSENDPSNHRGGDAQDFHIPSPRPAPDDDIAGLPETPPQSRPDAASGELSESGSDDPVWWYDQPRKRGGGVRRYWGEVEWIGGPEGDRLRERLNEIVRDLLDWAHTEQRKSESESDSETGSDAVSGEDGDTDDTRA